MFWLCNLVGNRAYVQWMVVAPIIKVSIELYPNINIEFSFLKKLLNWLTKGQNIFIVSQDKLKELEDGFFAVQAEQEAIALNASSPQVASEFLSDECK